LATLIALALKSFLTPGSSSTADGTLKSSSPSDTPCVSLRSGLGLRARHRSDAEVTAVRIQVLFFEHGDTPDSRKKLWDRVCTKLTHVLTSPNYSLLLSSESSMDLGSSVIDAQSVVNGVIDWAVTHDVFYVCSIPVKVDLSDIQAMGTTTTFVNLLTGYKVVTLEKVMRYQQLVNSCGVEVDVESSTWLLNVLTQSTEKVTSCQSQANF
jgi:hypothetical protein